LLFNFSIANAQTFNKPTAYWGLNYYSYVEDTATQDPFMEEKTKLLPTILIGYRDETSIRSTTNKNKKKNKQRWKSTKSGGKEAKQQAKERQLR